tara:strand:- start:48 stop:254 length:207 start_codon:yes stop_codon:yes gene_type:complete
MTHVQEASLADNIAVFTYLLASDLLCDGGSEVCDVISTQRSGGPTLLSIPKRVTSQLKAFSGSLVEVL